MEQSEFEYHRDRYGIWEDEVVYVSYVDQLFIYVDVEGHKQTATLLKGELKDLMMFNIKELPRGERLTLIWSIIDDAQSIIAIERVEKDEK